MDLGTFARIITLAFLVLCFALIVYFTPWIWNLGERTERPREAGAEQPEEPTVRAA